MERKGSASTWRALSALGLVGRLGLSIALPVTAGTWLGVEADRRLGTGVVFLFLGLFVGLAAGGYGAYRMIMKEMR